MRFLCVLAIFWSGIAWPYTYKVGYIEEGVGSWYGRRFHGRKTASGEIFNMFAMTAAHRSLPLGSVVLVTNTTNERTLRVRINDRGPFIDGRILDLSAKAGRILGMENTGLAEIKLEVLSLPKRKRKPSWYVQVASFTFENSANHLVGELSMKLSEHVGVRRVTYRNRIRVQVGPFASRREGEDAALDLAAMKPYQFKPWIVAD